MSNENVWDRKPDPVVKQKFQLPKFQIPKFNIPSIPFKQIFLGIVVIVGAIILLIRWIDRESDPTLPTEIKKTFPERFVTKLLDNALED